MNDKELIELKEYSDLDGTEIGELCWNLLSLFDSGLMEYVLTDSFRYSIELELDTQLRNFREHSFIDESEEKIETKRIIKSLIWR